MWRVSSAQRRQERSRVKGEVRASGKEGMLVR
jgi:hypothetical protein